MAFSLVCLETPSFSVFLFFNGSIKREVCGGRFKGGLDGIDLLFQNGITVCF